MPTYLSLYDDRMILETERLILRPLTRADLDAVHAYMSDPAVCRHTIAGPNTRDQTLAFLSEIDPAPDAHHEFAVVERKTGEVIGHVGCEPYGPGRSELGWILRRDRWGLGFASEAARAIAAFAASLPGVEEVVARCRPENSASERVMIKIGMVLIGRLEADVMIEGQARDSLLYAMPAHVPAADPAAEPPTMIE
jgi:RimJ/RimL family protein N-acetyltransferase